MSDSAPVLTVRNLGFGHPGEPPLLRALSFDLRPGVTLLRGDSGSGKTSLLRVLAGEWQGSGELVRHGPGEPCWFDPRDARFDALTAEGMMEVVRERHARLDPSDWRRHLGGFELAPHLHKPMYALSRGSRQKVALAAALSSASSLILLDEPAAGLDSTSIRYLTTVLAGFGVHTGQALAMVCSQELDGLNPAGVIDL
jgi:ABC-type multidrug transport system ATPase subunit